MPPEHPRLRFMHLSPTEIDIDPVTGQRAVIRRVVPREMASDILERYPIREPPLKIRTVKPGVSLSFRERDQLLSYQKKLTKKGLIPSPTRIAKGTLAFGEAIDRIGTGLNIRPGNSSMDNLLDNLEKFNELAEDIPEGKGKRSLRHLILYRATPVGSTYRLPESDVLINRTTPPARHLSRNRGLKARSARKNATTYLHDKARSKKIGRAVKGGALGALGILATRAMEGYRRGRSK